MGIVFRPLVCCIANSMRANNLCDVEEDVRMQRYTLPYHLGATRSLLLFKLLYAAAFLFVATGIALRLTPIVTLAIFLVIPLVVKNIRLFSQEQNKRTTFITAIHNFFVIIIPYMVCIWTGYLYRLFQ